MLATKALPYGSWNVTHSRIGRRLIHCCGFTENVHSFAPLEASSLSLMDFISVAGSGKTVLRFVTPQNLLVGLLTFLQFIDHPGSWLRR